MSTTLNAVRWPAHASFTWDVAKRILPSICSIRCDLQWRGACFGRTCSECFWVSLVSEVHSLLEAEDYTCAHVLTCHICDQGLNLYVHATTGSDAMVGQHTPNTLDSGSLWWRPG